MVRGLESKFAAAGQSHPVHKHRIAEIHAISMKRLSKVEAADDPSDGADDE